MRKLNMVLAPNGSISFTAMPIFNQEHNAIEVVVDYSKVGYGDYLKKVEVVGSTTPLVFEGIGDTLAFSIDRYLLRGTSITIQPIAYRLYGIEVSHEVKWSILKFPIEPSLNLEESGIIPPSHMNAIEALIDEKTSTTAIQTSLGIDAIDGSGVLYLNQRGNFESVEPPIGGYSNNLYFSATPSDIPTYETLTYTPDMTQSEHTHTTTLAEGDKLIHNYLFPNPVAVDSFPAGLWSFTFYGRVSTTQGTSELGISYFERKVDGSEVILFTAWSGDIANTTNDYIRWQITQPAFSIDPTSRMGAKVYIRTSRTHTTTLNFMVGDGYGAYLNNPNRIRHSQLRALNEQEDFQHIDAIDRANLDTLRLKLQAILEALNLV